MFIHIDVLFNANTDVRACMQVWGVWCTAPFEWWIEITECRVHWWHHTVYKFSNCIEIKYYRYSVSAVFWICLDIAPVEFDSELHGTLFTMAVACMCRCVGACLRTWVNHQMQIIIETEKLFFFFFFFVSSLLKCEILKASLLFNVPFYCKIVS